MDGVPAEELQKALELEGNVVGNMLMSSFDDSSALEMAARLDRCVDNLLYGVHTQRTPHSRSVYVDLLAGLALTAESLRTRSRGDQAAADRHAAMASQCLARVSMNEILPGGDTGRTGDGGPFA
ncbi:hypothetical protein ORV05_01420 [Amycolatopsis cynarae]|uniref:Uncharacterized protein n=1 Tax=Amycolatopsis cynarae TaxID=2995223 RepID=A0ABY7B2I8_9PSEU|nr:hypothetical protein [Amycolatopsis sp. HUAS 11-8]WAL66506.1 hypothetical protein ORV05_01420 [Amycolatopsis sp. HUAS 11-8]